MQLKTTLFLTGHYPNTYMEQFCNALHPDLELGTVCVAWFRQATKHCTDLLSNARGPPAYFWTSFINFIFPARSTEIVSQKVPISVHPKLLSMRDCQALLLDIVSDYIQRAPRYSAESTTNVMLWQVFHSLLGITALGFVLIGLIYIYNKYGQPKKVINIVEEFFKPEKRMQAMAKRSLRLSKAELRNIQIKPLRTTNEIAAADGVQVLTLKVGTKYEFLESIVKVSSQSVGKFHRLHDQHNKPKTDNKIESLSKAMQFLDNCEKLHLLLIFEDDVNCGEEVAAIKYKNNSPRIKMKSTLQHRLDGGSAHHKATGTQISSSSPRFTSQTETSIPRSSPTPSVNSSIPRNVQKRPPIAKKLK